MWVPLFFYPLIAMSYRSLPIIFATLLLSACATKVLDAPPNNPAPVVLPKQEASTVNVPVSLNLDAVRSEVLKRMPSPLAAGNTTLELKVKVAGTSLTAPVETQVSHKVWLRDLSMRMTGEQFVIDVQTEFSVATKLNSAITSVGLASCGVNEALPRVQFTLPGTIKLGPQGKLILNKGNWSTKWLKPCNLTALNLNVESVLNLPIIRGKVEQLVSEAIDSSAGNLSLRPYLANVWPQLVAPREIQPGIWLVLQPEKLGLAGLVGSGNILNTGVTVRARPLLVSGNKPNQPLPPIPPIEALPKAEGFHVELRGDIGLEQANQMLNQQLAGKPIVSGDRTILIEKLRLYGNGDKAVIGVTLKQPIEGEIYLLGKPVFDVEKNQLSLQNVEYSLATNSFLASTASWLLTGTLRETIEEKARVKFDEDLAGQLKKLRDLKIDLGQGGAVVKASVERVRPLGLFFTQQDIKVFVAVDGKLGFEYGMK